MTKQAHSVILGAGPVGRAIAKELAAKGQAGTVVTRDGRDIGAGISPVRADLSNTGQTIAACKGADAIYQCAAPPYHQWKGAFVKSRVPAEGLRTRSRGVIFAAANAASPIGSGVENAETSPSPLSAGYAWASGASARVFTMGA